LVIGKLVRPRLGPPAVLVPGTCLGTPGKILALCGAVPAQKIVACRNRNVQLQDAHVLFLKYYCPQATSLILPSVWSIAFGGFFFI
jgi:hypothetical protein